MSFPKALIGDLTNIQTGKLDANAAVSEGEYPFFTCAVDPLRIDKYAYDCDAILIAGNGDLNVKHYKGKFEAYQRTYILEVSERAKLDSRYLYYFMSKYVEKLREMSIGGVIKYIKLGMLTDAEIPLPPLAEQKRIAAILDKADAIRRKRQQAINLADDFLRATFLDMFGDPVTNPKGWEERPLKRLIIQGDKINYGVVQPGKDYPGGVPIVRVGDLLNGKITRSSLKLIDPAIDQCHKKSRLAGDEILIACVGSIGKVALTDKMLCDCNIARAVARVRPDKTLSRYYLAKFLETPFLQRYFLKETRTVSQPTLNINLIENAPILLPPKELQEEYDKIYLHVMRMTKKTSELVDSSIDIFNSLTQRAFRGEL
jgi:type I restriction enzyme, S subunit